MPSMSEVRPRVPKYVFSRIHISLTEGGAILWGSLPLAAVCLWTSFWPGNRKPNRFGDVPE
jgi:hypothetical protein